jgi:hypothetical protein
MQKVEVEWQGFEIAEHGRLPGHVIEEYESAYSHAGPAGHERRIASSRTMRRH